MKLTKDYNFAALYPEQSKEWHPTKNGNLKPEQLKPASTRKVWWICKNGHEWQATCHSRNHHNECGYCTNRLVGYGNDLLSSYPYVAKELHPLKSKEIDPSKIYFGSYKKVWWICQNGHEWKTSLFKRTVGLQSCPKCSHSTSKPEIFFYSELLTIFNKVIHRHKINGIEVDIFVQDINLGIEYDGHYFHKDEKRDLKKKQQLKKLSLSIINIREMPLKKISNDDLVVNRNEELINIFILFLKKLIDNNNLTTKVKKNILKYISEKKQRNHKIFFELLSGLPGPKKEKSLLILYPEIAKQWHLTKNGNLNPINVNPFSHNKVWWICNKSHSYQTSIAHKTNGRGCPYCANKKVGYGNDLQTQFPEIGKQWHPTKNGNLKPNEVISGSNKKKWWLCHNKHEWEAQISSRTSLGTGCPVCYKNSRKTNT